MAAIKCFEDLEIWQEARNLSKEIIKIAEKTDLKNDFKFKNQIKNSSVSLMDNIARDLKETAMLNLDNFFL